MAQSRTGVALPWDITAGAVIAAWRRTVRDVRLMAPLCVVLICGSFAASATLEMRLDRAHALREAAQFERARANDIASVAADTLARYARLGREFADSGGIDAARIEPGIRAMALFDDRGLRLRTSGDAGALILPPARDRQARMVLPGALLLPVRDRFVMVGFAPASLVPSSLMARAALVDGTGHLIAGGPGWPGGTSLRVAVPGWPLSAAAALDQQGALGAWYASLPLYLFAILGPAAVGAWLAALFVGAFERHGKAARSLKALRSIKPHEARLLVRLATAERGAADALRSKAEFLAHMSHELRTPLNAIIGFSDIIAHQFYGPAGHPKYNEYAHDIGEAGRSLHSKIGDILEFANIEAGRHPLRQQRIELALLAQECIAEQQGRAFSRRIDLSGGAREAGAVTADAQAVRRILANLIVNALAYTGEGGAVRLDIRFEEGAGIASLRDTGAGFSAGERRLAGRAFRRFDRGTATTGTGLGLAIAIELARRMGGAMRLASQPGGGSVMELRLPRAAES